MDNRTWITVNFTDKYDYIGRNIITSSQIAIQGGFCILILTVFIALMILYITIWSRTPKGVYKSLALEHIFTGYVHIACITLYTFNLPVSCTTMIENVFVNLDIIITLTTACLSWIIFLRLFLFTNGESLYNMKEVTLFSTLSLFCIQFYECVMDFVDVDWNLMSALRLTSVLLIMSVPVTVFLLLLKSLLTPSADVPKSQALFFMSYLLFFISSDLILLGFNLYSKNSGIIWSVLLYVRLGVEMVWYIICDCFCWS